MSSEAPARLRVDKWLWHARFFKSRAVAASCASSGRLRINGQRCEKPAQMVSAEDVLTFPQGGRIRVVRILGLGTRRGPAPEAQALYADLEPAASSGAPAPIAEAQAEPETDPAAAAGRPDKRSRREIARLRRLGS